MTAVSAGWLGDRLAFHAERCGIPGAAAAIIQRGRCIEAAAGKLNLETGADTTPDSLFQIGSITKVFTATLVLQLVERGRVALDDRLRRHLPWFRVASREATEAVTIAQLLSHTSGIDGDWFPDTGTGPDCIEKYARGCADLGQIHAPGDGISYTNAAPILLAAMLQEITGKSWDALLGERILVPLGAERMTTDFSALASHRVASGHLPDPRSKKLAVSKHQHLPRGMGPTGATLHSSALDLARFGEAFLRAGVTRSGARLLSESTIEGARQRVASWRTERWMHISMGLGWMLHDWSGHAIFGHDGATIGQYGFLRVAPHADLVVALLCNGGLARNLYYGLFREILAELADTDLPQASRAIDQSRFDFQRVAGTYENKFGTAEVFAGGDALKLRTTPRELAYVFGPEEWPLAPIAEDACRVENPALEVPEIIVFHRFQAGRAQCASLNYRDLPRIG